MDAVKNGSILIKATQWPSFLYNESEFSSRRPGDGLCRGYFLLRVHIPLLFFSSLNRSQVYRHIFTSPSSAFGMHI